MLALFNFLCKFVSSKTYYSIQNSLTPEITIMRYTLLITLISVLMLILCLQSASAQKKVKLPKKPPKEYVTYEPSEPDIIAPKSTPDKPLREVDESYVRLGHFSNGPHGIDVSHYQGSINWTQVAKDDHASFVYIKASEGSDNVDDMYQTNFRGAKRARIPVGSYHFFRANASPQAQLRNFMSQINIKQQDLLPLIDVETIPRGMSNERFRQVLDEFLRLVTREIGKRPMIYTGKNFYNKIFAGQGYNKKYKFFIACYTLEEPVLYNNDDFILWQYTSRGRANGIRGDVDMSRIRGRHTIKDIYF